MNLIFHRFGKTAGMTVEFGSDYMVMATYCFEEGSAPLTGEKLKLFLQKARD